MKRYQEGPMELGLLTNAPQFGLHPNNASKQHFSYHEHLPKRSLLPQ